MIVIMKMVSKWCQIKKKPSENRINTGIKRNVLHNLYFYNNMMKEIREAIEEHRFAEYKRNKLYGFENKN